MVYGKKRNQSKERQRAQASEFVLFKGISVRSTDWKGEEEEEKKRTSVRLVVNKKPPNDDNNEPPTHCQPALSLFTVFLLAFVLSCFALHICIKFSCFYLRRL